MVHYRYNDAVVAEARRLLPALLPACFATSANGEDRLAAEMFSLLGRAGLRKSSGHVDSLAEASERPIASGSPKTVEFRPWPVVREILRIHVPSCQIPGPACPVPCCRETRARIAHRSDVCIDDQNEEIDRCMMHHRRALRKQGQCGGDLIVGNIDCRRPSSPITYPCSLTINQGRPFTRALRALNN
ncbi:unnamed protein product, partial [Sphacelaria rigidula]